MTSDTVERFAQLIDLDSPPAYLDGGDPRRRPAVALAAALRQAAMASAPAPLSDSARLALRERLVAATATAAGVEPAAGVAARMTHAAESGQQRAKDAGRKISRRISTLVGSVMILTSVAGVGVATARALPGSPFYDLKRATEAIQLWATPGETAKGQRHLEFARTRLAEAAKLPADSPYLASTLHAMNDETRTGSAELLAAYNASGSVAALADVVTFTRKQYADLAKLGASLPSQVRQDALYSATLLTGVSHEVRALTTGVCHTCVKGDPSTGGPGPMLAPSTTPSTQPTVTTASSPATHPSPTPSAHPTNLIPTIPPLLHHHKAAPLPLPSLSPLPLLSSLAQLLGGM